MTSRPKRSKSLPSSPKRKRPPGSPPPASRVPLAKVKDDLSRYLRVAAEEEVIITRHGRPAGLLIGFATEEDWVDYRLEHHPDFLDRVAAAREALRAGRGVALEEIGG